MSSAAASGVARGGQLRPLHALQFAILVSLVSNLGRIPVLTTGEDSRAPLLFTDLAVALALAVGGLVIARNRRMRLDGVAISALLFAMIGGLSALAAVPRYGLNAFELMVSLAYLARWLFYFCIYVVVINAVTRRDATSVWKTLEWMLLAFAVFGIFQSLFLPGFAQMVYPDSRVRYDFDVQGHRLVSTVLDPNIAAAMISLGLLIHLAQLSTGARVAMWKPFIFFVAIVMTLSRSGVLMLMFGGGVILLVRGVSRRVMRLGAFLVVLILASLPWLIPFMDTYGKLSLGGSAAGRLVNLAQALTAFLDSPWIGVGFNTFGYYMEKRQGIDRLGLPFHSSDGGLLFAAVMTGIIGLAVYVTMMALVVRRCRAIWRRPEFTAEERGMCLGIAAGVVGLCVHSVFVNSLFSMSLLLPSWVLWGLTFAIGADKREPDSATRAPTRAVVLAGA